MWLAKTILKLILHIVLVIVVINESGSPILRRPHFHIMMSTSVCHKITVGNGGCENAEVGVVWKSPKSAEMMQTVHNSSELLSSLNPSPQSITLFEHPIEKLIKKFSDQLVNR